MEAQSPIPVLPYADLPSRWGIRLDRQEDSLQISVPPVPSLWHLPIGVKLGGFYLGFYVMAIPVMLMTKPAPRAGDLAGIIVMMLLYGGGFLALCSYAFRRLYWRTIFQVTPETLAIQRFDGREIRGGGRSWPRSQVIEVKLNRFTGLLLIRIVGRDFVEVYVSPNKQATQWVAEQIALALSSIAISNQRVKPSPITVEDLPMKPGPARTVLVAIATCLGAIGLFLLFFGGPFSSLSFFLFLVAAVPAGIALGHQDKQFYA
jgi:hypothetical protein